jgi:undecaprenyl-diphosphatase
MEIFQSIVLAIVQGLTEFLPISSSGHLVVLPWIFNWKDPGLSFDVALHFGTLLAVLFYFRKDIIDIFCALFRVKQGNSSTNRYPKDFFWILLAATVPGALAGFLLESYAEELFRHPLLVASNLILLGLALYMADHYTQKNKDKLQINWKRGILIGLAQGLAIFPGVSRSGATITAGLFLGLDRVSSARFSFLLSAPIIFGASILKLGDLMEKGLGLPELVGIATAALSGYLAIAGLIKFVEKASYRIFFWYRLGLGLLIIFLWLAR